MSREPGMKPLLLCTLAVPILLIQAPAMTITVNTPNDEFDTPSGAAISLREAIRDLGNLEGTIEVPSFLGPIELDSRLEIRGTGGRITIDGDPTDNHFQATITANPDLTAAISLIDSRSRTVTLRHLKFEGRDRLHTGIVVFGGSMSLVNVACHETATGVTALSNVALTAFECDFQRNGLGLSVSEASLADIYACLFAFHERAINASRVTSSPLLVRNCTFAENGGLSPVVGVSTLVAESLFAYNTFVDNTALPLSGPPSMQLEGNLFARNAIEGVNASSDQLLSLQSTATLGGDSLGYNLSDAASPVLDHAEDIISPITNMSRLGRYGGPLPSCFPLRGSPAINGGNASRAVPQVQTDGRGFARNATTPSNNTGNVMDIGAVETNPEGSILVTNTNATGAGSFAAAVAAATDPTNHITFSIPLTANSINLTSTLTFAGERNYNIDASGFRNPITTANDITLISVGASATASFDQCEFSDIIRGQATNAKSVVDVIGDAAFHRCLFKDNQTASTGAINVPSSGRLFLNETEMENCLQVRASNTLSFGGGAIHANGNTTVWNALFINNNAPSSNFAGDGVFASGGAVYAATATSTFRRCTFIGNRARLYGGALYFRGGQPVIEHCTFIGNNSDQGAIGAEAFATLRIEHCLFHENTINDSLNIRPMDRDLNFSGANPTLLPTVGNWTDAPDVNEDLVPVAQRNVVFRYAPLAKWGNRIRTRPLMNDAQLGSTLQERLGDPRDANNAPGPQRVVLPGNEIRWRTTPGAVQGLLDQDTVFSSSINRFNNNGDLVVNIGGKSGLSWEVETGPTPDNFSPTGIIVSPNVINRTVTIPMPTPAPVRLFIRFTEVTD